MTDAHHPARATSRRSGRKASARHGCAQNTTASSRPRWCRATTGDLLTAAEQDGRIHGSRRTAPRRGPSRAWDLGIPRRHRRALRRRSAADYLDVFDCDSLRGMRPVRRSLAAGALAPLPRSDWFCARDADNRNFASRLSPTEGGGPRGSACALHRAPGRAKCGGASTPAAAVVPAPALRPAAVREAAGEALAGYQEAPQDAPAKEFKPKPLRSWHSHRTPTRSACWRRRT